ncbi:nitrile hydratase accessory protein [Pseudaestuariivita sp.]|uniref:nitrile hydratase accessory protein n=1 Tax=Pseudaestuariivita sp. TaxID=2211669 RepID=UPI00405A3CA0
MTDDVPGFDAPWQAQLYAVTQGLMARGVFDAATWSEALGAALEEARAHGPVDGGPQFWEAWQHALETLVTARTDVTGGELDQTAEAWRTAYLGTPHGMPVRLE